VAVERPDYDREEPSRKSAQFATPRVTSRKLEVIKPVVARPDGPQTVAIVVERKSSTRLPLIIALVLVLVGAGAWFIFTQL
jgi:hypothetical protein